MNQTTCFHCSVLLYCMFQNNEISGKGKYVMGYLTSVGIYAMFCFMGQYLINTSEHLWNSIASSPWKNKPIWFKHGIKMLLIGTQKPLKMEPAGLYVLDLNFLLKALQVSYSYCNLMLQLNNKKK
ncbi:odorant receptor 85f-like [Lycorma delicatula]|uniref:odorant receptor 85f-like n=1 Tax=Lycorma delicatula TaxID=130591 RepID=UPI003F51051C